MPYAAPTPCAAPGCAVLSRGRYCPAHQRADDARRNARRPGSARSELPRLAKERDGWRCRCCGVRREDGAELEAHHLIPIARGGTHTLDNLVTLCRSCHAAMHEWER